MDLTLERTSSTPLYKQIIEQIRLLIDSGRLRSGSRMPTVRELASALSLTRLTVHAAYTELQAQGYIESFVGRGTFVSAVAGPSSYRPDAVVLGRTQRRLDELMRLAERPDLLSFAQAIPAPETYPASFQESVAQVMGNAEALSYGPIQGDPELRQILSDVLRARGIRASSDDILINGGAQQGVYLALQAFTRPDEPVLVEEPTYSGVIELASRRGQRVVGIPVDDGGIVPEALERICVAVRPRILYTIPTFHNPTGVSLHADRRSRLLSLAEKYNFLIVEDDVYGWLSYDGPSPPSLKADDEAGRVIYVVTFSKMLFPALRVGAVVATPSQLIEMAGVKESCDLVGSMLLQRALAEWLRRGEFEPHLNRVIPLYRERRDAMAETLARTFPSGSWTHAGGGFNTWVTLPGGTSEREFFAEAVEHGIGIARGSAFYHQPPSTAHLRLTFSTQTPARIAEGVERLGQLLDGHLHRRHTALVRATRRASPLV
ncbi:MAG: MocR-like pyridoxine biosynthesis transcription factor PdxR [Candidatus Xenobia bacterium]